MYNRVEPALGIRANISSPELVDPNDVLPPPPAVVNIDVSQRAVPRQWNGLQYNQDIRSLLSETGLGRYDIQNLLDRGYTPEQLLYFTRQNSTTPGITSARRASVLHRRLLDAGVNPESLSRLEFLRAASDQGRTIVRDQF